MYEKLKLAHSTLSDRIYLGRIVHDELIGLNIWAPGKRDMTQDFMACVIGRFNGYTEIIGTGDRRFEITVREITGEEEEGTDENNI